SFRSAFSSIAHLAGAGLGLSVALFFACGGPRSSGAFATVDGGGGGPADGAGGMTDAGGGATITPFGDAEPPCTSVHCSSDLHSILDCNNRVMQTCPTGQGCSGNGCVPACDSATANKGNLGCDFFSAEPAAHDLNNACFVAYVANSWDTP